MAILQVDDIHTYYGDAYVLQGLSLQLEQGQILGLLGRNGVGKTTLVNSIVGFTPPRTGTILFKGADITRAARLPHAQRRGKPFGGRAQCRTSRLEPGARLCAVPAPARTTQPARQDAL